MSSLSSSKPAPYRPPHLCKKNLKPSPYSPPPSLPPTPPPSLPLTPPPSPPRASVSGIWRRGVTPSQSVESWRIGAGPSSSVKKGIPSFKDLEIGMIFYLPLTPAPASSRIHTELTRRRNQEPWNHPAVVVDKYLDAGEECVKIRLFTTFSGRGGLESKDLRHHHFFMLADNREDTVPHGDTDLATMKGGAKFGKKTYLNLSAESQYPIEYKHLDLYNNQAPMQFDAFSLHLIQDEADRIVAAKSSLSPFPERVNRSWR